MDATARRVAAISRTSSATPTSRAPRARRRPDRAPAPVAGPSERGHRAPGTCHGRAGWRCGRVSRCLPRARRRTARCPRPRQGRAHRCARCRSQARGVRRAALPSPIPRRRRRPGTARCLRSDGPRLDRSFPSPARPVKPRPVALAGASVGGILAQRQCGAGAPSSTTSSLKKEVASAGSLPSWRSMTTVSRKRSSSLVG